MRLSIAWLVLATVAALPAQASSFLILPPAQSDTSPSIVAVAPIPFAKETFSALKAAGAAAATDPRAPAADTAIAVVPSASMVVIEALPLSPETSKAIREAEAASAAAAVDHGAETAAAPPIPVTPSASMVVLGDPAPQIDPAATVASIGSRTSPAALPTVFRGGVISTSASLPAIQASAPAQADPQSPEATDQTVSGTEAATEAASDASPSAAE